MTFSHGHALLIGVGTYKHAPSLDVPITASDARALADVLRDPQFCGYEPQRTTLLCDEQATSHMVLGALDRLAEVVGEADTLFVFYSGHGHYLTDGSYCLTTHDSRFAKQSGKVAKGTAVSHQELLARLQAIRARRVLLLFNACHAGEISPTLSLGAEAAGESLPHETTAALLATGTGRIIITACRQHQYSFIGTGGHTIFTQALLDGLRGKGTHSQNGYISVFDLYSHLYTVVDAAVKRDVPASVRRRYGETQEPELTIVKGVGPFAVALYQGATRLGTFDGEDRSPPLAAVRKIDEAESLAALRQLYVAGSVVRGNQTTTISRNTTHDHSRDNSKVQISIGSAANSVVTGRNNGTITYITGPRPDEPTPADALQVAIAHARQEVEQACQRNDADLEVDLSDVTRFLEAACIAQQQGKQDRKIIKLREAQGLTARLATEHPSLNPLARMLETLNE